MNQPINVRTISYLNFVREYKNIFIPDFQRPYRWSKVKVEDLLQDLQEFFLNEPMYELDYYMGGILLYALPKGKGFQVIDGQQRLTTLNLMYHIIHGWFEKGSGQNFIYNNHLSVLAIKINANLLKLKREFLLKLDKKQFFDKLVFTLIETVNEDQCFTFFDTVNNRGVGLSATDYLKAYHLREVGSEELQSKLAEEWESVAIKEQTQDNKEKGLLHLLNEILFRSREWKGQSVLLSANKDTLLESFQKKTIAPEGNAYSLFRCRTNLKYAKVAVRNSSEIQFIESNAAVEDLMFSIRQPLFKGLNFFQYIQKYYQTLQNILFKKVEDKSLIQTQEFFIQVYGNDMSEYLKYYMQLCLVMYYDSFGTDKIYQAVQYFDYFIGSIRILKHYVRLEAIRNSLKSSQASNNLLDIIANAYLPEEVFEFIKNEQSIKQIYESKSLTNNIGVRMNYKSRVIAYYNFSKKPKNLKGRLEWIR